MMLTVMPWGSVSFRNHVKCGVCLCAIVLQQTEEAGVIFFFLWHLDNLFMPPPLLPRLGSLWLCPLTPKWNSSWQWGHAFAKEMRPQVFILSKNGLERGKVFDFYDCGNFEMTDVDRKHKGWLTVVMMIWKIALFFEPPSLLQPD